jgi:hypothetical protein
MRALRCATARSTVSFSGLEPDGCLLADRYDGRKTKPFEKHGCRQRKGVVLALGAVPAKEVLFCDGVVFSLDRSLLMGAIMLRYGP